MKTGLVALALLASVICLSCAALDSAINSMIEASLNSSSYSTDSADSYTDSGSESTSASSSNTSYQDYYNKILDLYNTRQRASSESDKTFYDNLARAVIQNNPDLNQQLIDSYSSGILTVRWGFTDWYSSLQ